MNNNCYTNNTGAAQGLAEAASFHMQTDPVEFLKEDDRCERGVRH